MEPTQTYDVLPSVEATQRYNPSSLPKATQDFTLDPTDPPESTQAYDLLSKAAQDFTLEPTQIFVEPDPSSPSLSRTPNSYSDYAKTPPKKPIESHSLTSPSLSFSTSPPKLEDKKKASYSHLPGDEVKWQSRSQPSNPTIPSTTNAQPENGKKAMSLETTTNLKQYGKRMLQTFRSSPAIDLHIRTLKAFVRSNLSLQSDEEEVKSERKRDKREAPTRKRKREAPSRKQKQPVKKAVDYSRKTKRLKVTRDQKYDKDLRISSNYVKKCIEEVTDSALDKKRFKALCRKVSKQLVGMWSKRKPSKKKSIEKWLQRRHRKILRLVEKYLQLELV